VVEFTSSWHLFKIQWVFSVVTWYTSVVLILSDVENENKVQAATTSTKSDVKLSC